MIEVCWFTEAILGLFSSYRMKLLGSATDLCHLTQISPVDVLFFPSVLTVEASGCLLLSLWSIGVSRSINLPSQIYNVPVYINSPVTLCLLSKLKSSVEL